MPIFEVNIDREVIAYDRFTRYILADTEDEARVFAEALASKSNNDCPDDCAPTNHDEDLGDFFMNDLEEVATDSVDDVVLDAKTGEEVEVCVECGAGYAPAGDGYMDLCPSCADAAEDAE